MPLTYFNQDKVHPTWQKALTQGLAAMDQSYLQALLATSNWLPGADKIFNAFTLSVSQSQFVLMGESPYPRPESANGFAFWDAAVKELWSPSGLSAKVNRATSLRNICKMLLIAEGLLKPPALTQADIAEIPKEELVATGEAFFGNFLHKGFLLLNATLVWHFPPSSPRQDAQAWRPFMETILAYLVWQRPQVQFILLGKIALLLHNFLKNQPNIAVLQAEHPYNLSFITNPRVQAFFQPLHLLKKFAPT